MAVEERRVCDTVHLRNYPGCFEDCGKDTCDGKPLVLSKEQAVCEALNILIWKVPMLCNPESWAAEMRDKNINIVWRPRKEVFEPAKITKAVK